MSCGTVAPGDQQDGGADARDRLLQRLDERRDGFRRSPAAQAGSGRRDDGRSDHRSRRTRHDPALDELAGGDAQVPLGLSLEQGVEGSGRVVGSPQRLSETDRRIVAGWAADCAERVLGLFESRPRFPTWVRTPLGPCLRREGCWSGCAGRRRCGDQRDPLAAQSHLLTRQGCAATASARVGENRSGPLGPGLLASGQLGSIIRELQAGPADPHPL